MEYHEIIHDTEKHKICPKIGKSYKGKIILGGFGILGHVLCNSAFRF